MVSALFKKRLLPALGVGLISAAGVAMSSDRANAFTFGGSWDDGCKVGSTSVGSCSLQGLLNASGYSSVNTANPSGVGTFSTAGVSTVTGNILFSVAGFSTNNVVGLYNIGTPSIQQVFSTGTPKSVGKNNLLNIPVNISLIPGLQNTTVGFFLTNPKGQTFYSTGSHFLSYALGNSSWLIAFEDLPAGETDFDYNDFVGTFSFAPSRTSVPEPAALGGLVAIGSLMTLARRRKVVAD